MAKHLNRKVGEMVFDKLIAGISPAVHVSGGKIRKVGTETEFKRGTVFAKSSVDNKLVVLGTTAEEGETLVADCILCDDVVVGTGADVNAAVYTAGNFNYNALIAKSGHTISEAEKDKLRERGIYLGVVLE